MSYYSDNMKKAMLLLLMMLCVSNAYALDMNVNFADDVISTIQDAIKSIFGMVIDLVKSLFNAMIDIISTPFVLVKDSFTASLDYWNTTLGGFSPIAYITVVGITIYIAWKFFEIYLKEALY